MENSALLQKAVDIKNEIKKVVMGKDEVIEKILTAVIAKGHILLEDIPGVGKTTLALAFSKTMSLSYNRVQFTPDVLPTDITGFSLYDKNTGKFVYKQGAAFCNLFLADEINRTSSKTQSALLEMMEEGSVTVDGVTRVLPEPFIVIATENPIGSVGTQMLPESQLDRFTVCLSMGYPDAISEVSILKSRQGVNPLDTVASIATIQDVMEMQAAVENIFTDDKIYRYIAELSAKTRENEFLKLGLSPRGSLSIAALARAHAFLSGRNFVIPDDVAAVFADASAHRLVLSPKAKAASMSAVGILEDILKTVGAPAVAKNK